MNDRLKRSGARRLLVLADRQPVRTSPRLSNEAAWFADRFAQIGRLQEDRVKAAAGAVPGGAPRAAFAHANECAERWMIRRTVKRFVAYGLPKHVPLMRGTDMHKRRELQRMFGDRARYPKRYAGGRDRNERINRRHNAGDASNPYSHWYLWEPDYVA